MHAVVVKLIYMRRPILVMEHRLYKPKRTKYLASPSLTTLMARLCSVTFAGGIKLSSERDGAMPTRLIGAGGLPFYVHGYYT